LGRIVFTTFHQSTSYEDFIEGIKPETTPEGRIIYDIKKGVFKELCEKAGFTDKSNIEISIRAFQEDIENKGTQELQTSTGKRFNVDFAGGSTFRINPIESGNENPRYPASIDSM